MKLPTYFISHGGGPWPWLKQEMPFFGELETFLKSIPKQIGVTPKAVLVVSAHWEASEFSVMTSPQPSMIYDYFGFPAHTYQIQYPAPGSPEVALKVQGLLQRAGIGVRLDPKRGFDHGTFVPLVVIYPKADVPVLQLSLRRDLDPKAHFELGRAIASLREEGVLIIGSGLSYHNLRALRDPQAPVGPSLQFDNWLQRALVGCTPGERYQQLLSWSKAPAARDAHPREDHLLPIMVAVGAAENEVATLVHHELFMGTTTVSSFRFG